MRGNFLSFITLCGVAALAAACSGGSESSETSSANSGGSHAHAAEAQPMAMGPVGEYASDDSLPKILFADGQLSLNDRCPVRNVKLNLYLDAMYVNGRPIGFC